MHAIMRPAASVLSFLLLSLSFVACGENDTAGDRSADSTAAPPPLGSAVDTGAAAAADTTSSSPSPLALVPVTIRLKEANHLVKRKEFTLNIPEGFGISVAADGLQRLRFMAFSPDRRLFATDMRNMADNDIGRVYAFDGFDPATRRFARRTVWLDGLRNPNSVAFYTDRNGASWLYVALTDRLARYRYEPGSGGPSGPAETLATFPDYGKSYREGGWHLTRTVAFGDDGRLYVSVGSSCNVCEEKEEVRATVLQMNPDGSEQRIFARGLRNAVGIRWTDGALWGTNMGADHLGLDMPEDTFYRLKEGAHYGWPYAYEYQGTVHADPVYGGLPDAVKPEAVPTAWGTFPAHSAPLGFDRFTGPAGSPLHDCFLVALHGSGSPAMKRGYSIVRLADGGAPQDFINGFQQGKERVGRPCDILRDGPGSFFFSDDHAGVLYYVYQKEG